MVATDVVDGVVRRIVEHVRPGRAAALARCRSGGHMEPTGITPSQAKEMLDRGDRVVFVDARNPVAWGSSDVKLPGAIRIPADGVDEHLDEVPRDGTTITYCT